MEAPETRYVKTPDGAHIAYQVFGDGPFDLVYVPGFASNVEYMWRVEPFARGLRRLGSFARVIVFDRRGTGLSDRIDETNLPTLEARMDDIRAVMDAAAVERAALFGSEDGALLCAVFAAAHPSRVFACVLHGTGARGLRAPDYLRLVREAGFELVSETPSGPSEEGRAELRSLPLAERFRGYDEDALGVTVLSFVARRPA